jgi:hypothetical protein
MLPLVSFIAANPATPPRRRNSVRKRNDKARSAKEKRTRANAAAALI